MSRVFKTEDEVRDYAGDVLELKIQEQNIKQGVGQLTTFNQLGFTGEGKNNKPDGWYLPKDKSKSAIILETKNSDEDVFADKWVQELLRNMEIAHQKYNNIIGILYNGYEINVFKNRDNITQECSKKIEKKNYYLNKFKDNTIDKEKIYNLTASINNNLHFNFGIKNLYHRMIFTACALVAVRYDAQLTAGMKYQTMHSEILSTLNKSLEDSIRQNLKLNLLTEVYTDIKMNITDNQKAIDSFIDDVKSISKEINSDNWRGEDVMGIFFNEFNRYKPKSENGQVFTPEHITSLMYRLLDCNMNDRILDGACGSGGFLTKAMSKMMDEAGGINASKSKKIKSEQLFGIEFDREIYALACANMLIHKDGKTNLEQLDTRSIKASEWISSKNITKVLMNPPFERKYGCMDIVLSVVESVPTNTLCGFILPDKKLEKDSQTKVKRLLKNNRIEKIIKLSEKTFSEGITTSIFIIRTGVPQNDNNIIGYYIENDGLETVKNKGRQDIKNKWTEIEDYWVKAIHDGEDPKFETKQLINPKEHLSYQMPKKPFELYEEDFIKTLMDYEMFEKGIDVKEFEEKLIDNVMYSSEISKSDDKISVVLKGGKSNE